MCFERKWTYKILIRICRWHHFFSIYNFFCSKNIHIYFWKKISFRSAVLYTESYSTCVFVRVVAVTQALPLVLIRHANVIGTWTFFIDFIQRFVRYLKVGMVKPHWNRRIIYILIYTSVAHTCNFLFSTLYYEPFYRVLYSIIYIKLTVLLPRPLFQFASIWTAKYTLHIYAYVNAHRIHRGAEYLKF